MPTERTYDVNRFDNEATDFYAELAELRSAWKAYADALDAFRAHYENSLRCSDEI